MAKEWSWSYSKYKNYDTCPKRHYEVDIAKNYTDSSEQLMWGNQVHDALAKAAAKGAALPDSMKDYQKWIDDIKDVPGTLLVEMKMAINKAFQPTSWFANDAWFRGICDIALIGHRNALARDYKTGKMTHDARQLMLMSQCIFAHYPKVQHIDTQFVWLKEGCTTPESFDRDTIVREWPPVLDHVKQMKQAADTMTYPPKPGKLCARYCPVLSCPYHGKRQ
jgi:PD-(D/E)XK nuclease superfamily